MCEYLARCLVKHLESLRVNYDYTVRDCDGSVIQFYYGEDSVDVCKSAYLNRFSFFAKNFRALLHKLNPTKAFEMRLDTDSVNEYLKHSGSKVCKLPYH